MVLLHLWMVLRQLRSGPDEALRQALFDHFCSDMDANLREMGVGDLTVPKRMQAFGEAFYGRSAAYDRALAEGPSRWRRRSTRISIVAETSKARDGLPPIRRTRSPRSLVAITRR